MRWSTWNELPPIAEINTTPLIDVLLVLLITLILAIPPMTHAIRLELARGESATGREIVTLDISFDGAMYWNDTPIVDWSELETVCKSAAGKAVQPIVRVRSDRRAKYDWFAKVLATAQRSGIRDVTVSGNAGFAD